MIYTKTAQSTHHSSLALRPGWAQEGNGGV
ncbi:MAG: hypothetical protein Greene041619_709 [Candidatus Peregrinibacteria bacterium Greene0416_19]|nr:MAG: hypothetical protein Greene041619_709 [Candidatus Peregrinibacteria bacterium Greene0416_19]